MIWDLILDTLLDTAKLLPFLFLTYLLMEYLEHRTGDKTLAVIRRADRMGPLFGGVLGIVPQCGFSAAASGFYAGRVIRIGTLIAVFMSTSDEMLPIMLSRRVPVLTVLKILLVKAGLAVAAGFLVDYLFPKFNIRKIGSSIHDLCEHDKCGCESDNSENIFRSSLMHTLQIAVFILAVSFALNLMVEVLGEEGLRALILNQPVVGELLAGVMGLLPNCAASVMITTLYLDGAMSAGAMMSGLLVGAGVGLIVLFRTNRNLVENIKITVLLYGCGVLGGLLVNAARITFI
ncbi:MAG: putative manganese transporter [Lachnospiraceae bacterium]|nr:putative manganese transporter [Lachnospiraceae bacterium]